MKGAALHRRVADRIDRLVSLDIGSRGVSERLYAAARGRKPPLCLQAARKLRARLRPGSYVFIATGWHDRPQVNSQIAETDGPVGAAALAAVLHRVCGAVPILLVEEQLIEPMRQLLRAAGLAALAPEEAVAARSSPAALHAASVVRFSKNPEEARTHSTQLLAAFKPPVLVAIEVGGMNAADQIHTFRGDDATYHTPKFDVLFDAARRGRATTIGIGDGGNEIGFGNIHDQAVRIIPNGRAASARVIVPTLRVDHLVPAAVSNWGAHGVAACLCLLAGRPDALHTPGAEIRLIDTAARAGLIDGVSGYVEPRVDGMPADVHGGIVSLLHTMVTQAHDQLSGAPATKRP